MASLVRFGVSIDEQLLEKFDRKIAREEYTNRSEALRDLIRDSIIADEWTNENEEVVGTLTIIYDHHKPQLQTKLTTIQHDYENQIISTMHVHINHDNCLEVTVIKGSVKIVHELAAKIISLIGVKHGKLTATTTGEHLH